VIDADIELVGVVGFARIRQVVVGNGRYAMPPGTFGARNNWMTRVATGFHRFLGIWLPANGWRFAEPSELMTVEAGSKISWKPLKSPLRHPARLDDFVSVTPNPLRCQEFWWNPAP